MISCSHWGLFEIPDPYDWEYDLPHGDRIAWGTMRIKPADLRFLLP